MLHGMLMEEHEAGERLARRDGTGKHETRAVLDAAKRRDRHVRFGSEPVCGPEQANDAIANNPVHSFLSESSDFHYDY